MPLILTCSKCRRKAALSEEERKVFFKEIRTKEQLLKLRCPKCEEEKRLEENQL